MLILALALTVLLTLVIRDTRLLVGIFCFALLVILTPYITACLVVLGGAIYFLIYRKD
jgi:hypothetical protein